jgi:hypothetical protein
VVQLWTVAAALLLAASITASVDPLLVALILVPMTAATFFGARPMRANRRLETDGLLFLLALVGAPAWWAYAAAAAGRALTAGTADEFSWGLAHWPLQAALGIFMALIVLVMAFWPPGRRLHGTICCASSVVLAAGWLLYPDSSGSVDSTVMSVLAVLWGAAVFVCRVRGTGPGQAEVGTAGGDGPAPTNLRAVPPRGKPARAGSSRGAGRDRPGAPWPDTEVLWPATVGCAARWCLAFAVAAVQAALALARNLGAVADQEA